MSPVSGGPLAADVSAGEAAGPPLRLLGPQLGARLPLRGQGRLPGRGHRVSAERGPIRGEY